jgi:hypothetical protein
MANQADLNGLKKAVLGSVNNGNPNHYRTVKKYTETAGLNVIIAGIIVAAFSTTLVTGLEWLIKPVEKTKPMKFNRKRY